MQTIRMDLSNEQRRELQQVSRQAVGRVALRAQMVLLCARGYRMPQIAQIHDCGEDVVRLWLHAVALAGWVDLENIGQPVRYQHCPCRAA